MSTITLGDIIELFVQTHDGIKQQTLPGEFDEFISSFPRDPAFIVRGIEAVYGLTININLCDFYKKLDIPDERRDFFSFYEYLEGNVVEIYLNTNIQGDGSPLLSSETLRFAYLKEVFTAVIRRSFLDKGRPYPDTVKYSKFIASNLDWIAEKFSVHDFEDADYSDSVSIENAAEILSLLFLVDIQELYEERVNHDILADLGIDSDDENGDNGNGEALKFALFQYDKFANKYQVKVRFIVVLVKTDFILKLVEGIKSIVTDVRDLFSRN